MMLVLSMENSTKRSFDPCSSLVMPVGMQASHSPPVPPAVASNGFVDENQPPAKIADA